MKRLALDHTAVKVPSSLASKFKNSVSQLEKAVKDGDEQAALRAGKSYVDSVEDIFKEFSDVDWDMVLEGEDLTDKTFTILNKAVKSGNYADLAEMVNSPDFLADVSWFEDRAEPSDY